MLGREVNLPSISNQITHFISKVVFLLGRLQDEGERYQETWSWVCPCLFVPFWVSQFPSLWVGLAVQTLFSLDTFPTLVFLESSPVFSFSTFPHLQALICVHCGKRSRRSRVERGLGLSQWKASGLSLSNTEEAWQLEPWGFIPVTAGESTSSHCRGDSDRLNPNQMCTRESRAYYKVLWNGPGEVNKQKQASCLAALKTSSSSIASGQGRTAFCLGEERTGRVWVWWAPRGPVPSSPAPLPAGHSCSLGWQGLLLALPN